MLSSLVTTLSSIVALAKRANSHISFLCGRGRSKSSLPQRRNKRHMLDKISVSAKKLLRFIASNKAVTSTELRSAKLVTQHEFLPSRIELLSNRYIKRKQDLHPRSKRGRRADIWVPTRKGLDLLGISVPIDFIEESSYNVSIKRQISLQEKKSIDVDLSSGYCILLPELSVEPQELIENFSIDYSRLFLVEKNVSTFEQIERKWPQAKTWNGNLTDAIRSSASGSVSYIHADLMSIFGEETIEIILSTKDRLKHSGSWIRFTNTAMSFRDNWSSKQLYWNLVAENLLDLYDIGCLTYDEFRHYLLYSNRDLLHSAWMSWSCLVKTHLQNNMAVIPKGVVHYRGNSTSTPMESCWFSLTPNNNPKEWIKYSLSELTRFLNNANSNFYDNQNIQ